MPGARRSSRRGSRKPVQSDSSDDDERASAAPVVSPRIRDAAKKASLRKEAEAKLESEDLASSSRSARRERRKSRRGSKKAPGEGKTVESVDAAELDARAQRRAQRRNKRTPRHNTPSARTGFFASSPTGNESSRSPSRSRGRQDAPEMTEVEVIAWQHRIKQPNGDDAHSDDQSDDDNVVIDHEHSSDDGDGGPRRHPVVKNSGGAWGSGPADGLKPRTSPGKRRELSPTNVRRRAMEKKKSREQLLAQPKKALGANNNADDGDGSPLARQRGGRTRTGRRGSKKAPEPSESSSSSSESDEEITGRRRRGGRQRTRDRQNKPARGRRGTGNEPNTPGTPKDVPVGHDKTLRRTSHELQLVDGQDTPSGHKKLTRTSPKTDTPNSKDTSPHNIHAKLKQQLEKDGLKKKEVPEGKVESLVAHRKRMLRSIETGEPLRHIPVYIPPRSRSQADHDNDAEADNHRRSSEGGDLRRGSSDTEDPNASPRQLRRVGGSPRLIDRENVPRKYEWPASGQSPRVNSAARRSRDRKDSKHHHNVHARS